MLHAEKHSLSHAVKTASRRADVTLSLIIGFGMKIAKPRISIDDITITARAFHPMLYLSSGQNLETSASTTIAFALLVACVCPLSSQQQLLRPAAAKKQARV
jgi:hypothetical protein